MGLLSTRVPARLTLLSTILFLAPITLGDQWPPSSCGNLTNVSYPFRLRTDPINCGYPQYELTCDRNRTILELYSFRYFVEQISYENHTARLTLAGAGTCLSPDLPSLLPKRFLYGHPFTLASVASSVIFVSCPNAVTTEASYFPVPPCAENSSASGEHLYALAGPKPVSFLRKGCRTAGVVPAAEGLRSRPGPEAAELLSRGFDVSWDIQLRCRDCMAKGLNCSDFTPYSDEWNPPHYRISFWGPEPTQQHEHCFNSSDVRGCRSLPCFFAYVWQLIIGPVLFLLAQVIVTYIIPGRTIIGISCFSVYLVYKLRRRHISMDSSIEEFLNVYRNSMPIRYSYWHIKKMTNHFKEKLGQGGYGSVFKGKLTTGRLVAVKVLENSKGNGQEFINEVSTIGRIHHANVVQLIGFCSQGSRRALVYEFMSNGSLDQYVYSQEAEVRALSWEKMRDVALGIARGIEYLHRGCDMRILHFDIKPHNILLDDNFNPKVSDFGLAKLQTREDSKVSVTAARGTIGYIAPELFYRRVGEVSHKSDVYSYGMLLLEMAGRRKNLNPRVERSSQAYFPSWIYDQLDQGRDLEMEDAAASEKEIARKLTVIALWCIQMRPIDRPSMSQVLEMLENSAEELQMPPRPFQSSPDLRDHGVGMESTEMFSEYGTDISSVIE